MSRTKKFLFNSFSSVLMQIVIFISGLIIPRLMLVTYGSEINGLISSITQFVGYFSLVEAGLAAASIYALYKPLSEKNHIEINGIVSASRKYYLKSGYIFTVLVIFLAGIYPIFIKTESLSRMEVGFLVLIIGVSGALNFFAMAKYRVLITADQNIYVINYLFSIATIVNTVIIVIMTKMDTSIVLLRLVALISVFIPPIILHFYVKNKYTFLKFNFPPITKPLEKRWDALILQVLGSVQTAAPIILATIFTSLELVSVYAIFNMVVMGVMQIIGIFGTGLSASFGELIAKNEQIIFQKAYSEYEFMSYSIISFLFSCTFVLIMPFINLYTADIHDVNYNLPLLGFLFVLNSVFYSIKNPQGTLVSSAGLFKETKYQTLTQALIAVVLGAILAKPLGLIGILIGLITSNLYRDFDLLIYIPRVLNTIKIKTSFLRVLRMFVQIFLVGFPFLYIDLPISNYTHWIFWAIIVAIYSLFIIILTNMMTEMNMMNAIMKRFGNIIKQGS